MAIVRGRLDMYRRRRRRRAARSAVTRQVPHESRRRIQQRRFERRRRGLLVDRWLWEGVPHADRVVQIEGLRHLETALTGGVGAILASAHFGYARLIKPVLGAHGWPALLVGPLQTSGKWPPIAAEDLPVTLNLRPHLAALRHNKPLIILVDGEATASVMRVPVGGIHVDFAPGAMRLARTASAPVLPTFLLDHGTLRDPLAIRLVIHPPLDLINTDDATADVLENLRRFAAVYGEEIERSPHNAGGRFLEPGSGDCASPQECQHSGGDDDWPREPAESGRTFPAHGR
jgi:lauroyl/myristoyl acyltransferase